MSRPDAVRRSSRKREPQAERTRATGVKRSVAGDPSAAAKPRQRAATPAVLARPRKDNERRAARRQAIIAAALEEFSARGFAAARLDDVAKRAGVAKGTIYLYFDDKEHLFQEIVRTIVSPLVGAIEAEALADRPLRAVAEAIVEVFAREIVATRRGDVIRLVLAEGPRFPSIAEFYFREVISRAIPAVHRLIERGIASGEIRHEALARFPLLLISPALVAVLWAGLFDKFQPLDVRALLRAHIDILFGKGDAS